MEVTTIGLDLGKDVFQVHGITDDGTVVFNRTIRRRQLLNFFETLPCCLVGIEACGSAHHWARELIEIGHDVRLMPAVYVKPYVKRGKTDAVDAEAICEAVTRPTMRFVAVKSKEQQALLTIHRVRQLIVRQKTQMLNVIRGLLREFGHVIGNGPVAAMRFIKAFQTDIQNACIPGSCSFLNESLSGSQLLRWQTRQRGSSGRSSPKKRTTAKQHKRRRRHKNCKTNAMMARAVIRKPEIPCFVLNSQVRVADWEQVCGTHPLPDRALRSNVPRGKASGKYRSRDQRPDTGLY